MRYQYRGYDITPHVVGWEYVHRDFDGGPEGAGEGPADHRFGTAPTLEQAFKDIDDIEEYP